MLLPCLTALWAIWQQVLYQEPPKPIELSLVAFGALIVNCLCTFILIRFKNFSGSLTRGAFLSARNDALAKVGNVISLPYLLGKRLLEFMLPEGRISQEDFWEALLPA